MRKIKGDILLKLILYIGVLVLGACGSESDNNSKVDYVVFDKDVKATLVNPTTLNINTDMSESVFLEEKDYGIRLSMFSDNKFYFDIEGIGEGAGFWSYSDKGYFHLHARYERSPAGLNFFIISLDSLSTKIDVIFDDRYGVQRRSLKVSTPY